MSFSCSEPQMVPVTFLSASSYLALPGTSGQDEVSISFQFRTWNKEGLLLSSKLHQTSGGLLLYLSDGKVKMSIYKPGKAQSDITAGNRKWISMQKCVMSANIFGSMIHSKDPVRELLFMWVILVHVNIIPEDFQSSLFFPFVTYIQMCTFQTTDKYPRKQTTCMPMHCRIGLKSASTYMNPLIVESEYLILFSIWESEISYCPIRLLRS